MTQSRDESRKRLSQGIADDLQREIVSEGFIANRRLPTEFELMERFAVSRSVIREAAQLLVQRGLVTVAPGRGMIVAEFDGAQIAEQFSLVMLASDGTFEQLLQLRLSLEMQIATAAAVNPASEVLDKLANCIAQGERVLAKEGPIDRDEFLDADMTFHETMALASGNPFFELVCRPINTFLRSHYRLRDGYPSDPQKTLEEHREILDALHRRDTFAARQAAEEHLRRLLRKWRDLPQGPSAPSIRHLNAQDNLQLPTMASEGSTGKEFSND